MLDKDQCPAHTRTLWGTSSHRYSPRLRYFFMGLLLALFLVVIVCSVVFLIAFARTSRSEDGLSNAVVEAVRDFNS